MEYCESELLMADTADERNPLDPVPQKELT